MSIYQHIAVALAFIAVLASPVTIQAEHKEKNNRLTYLTIGVVGGVALASAAYYYRDNLQSGYESCSQELSDRYYSFASWVRLVFAPKSASDHFKEGASQIVQKIKK